MKQLCRIVMVLAVLRCGTACEGVTEAQPASRSAPRTLAVRLTHASHRIPDNAPHAIVRVPKGFDPSTRLALVLFLHGWRGCASVLEGSGRVACRPNDRAQQGWGLGAQHDRAGTNTIFVVPQLTWRKREGKPGRFADPGFARAFVEEIVSVMQRELGAEYGRSGVASITLVAHSAGYETALAIIEHGSLGRTLRHIVLMDALYAGSDAFAAWATSTPRAEGSRLVSLYTGRSTTWQENRRLLRELSAGASGVRAVLDPAGSLGQAIRTHEVVIARSPHPHGIVPARHLTEVLRALGLPPRVDAVRSSARLAR